MWKGIIESPNELAHGVIAMVVLNTKRTFMHVKCCWDEVGGHVVITHNNLKVDVQMAYVWALHFGGGKDIESPLEENWST